ncbi:NUDIX hydrolase [Chryseobacterium defluvii]|uniref:Putative NUDIX family NTP pyrophosphohydrolase n=1 Tax=Chryseobacterium defluvii TaxID=160396 RepID=A0A495SCU0_9FLAO|nr:NUDIX domain-containing protein [Chryseobacterium defluvii]RKS98058.1 putative NUDIX family NTP pyrophosphohydrolase [Chryseobacterium defluvii]
MKKSAGLLLFKKSKEGLLYFLVHPGGPFWKNKDLGSWSIPKGEMSDDEDALERAKIEFQEETGQEIAGEFIPLSAIQQKGGKIVYAWAVEGDVDLSSLSSNTFDLEWPPKSGKILQVPEVDQWEWFTLNEAKSKINPAQVSFLLEVQKLLESNI